MFSGLIGGFSQAISLTNIFACFIGCVIGTIVGVLPGLGPVSAMALLIPFTFSLDPVGAIIMMAGIYYGSAYGGSTTSILLKVPGEAGSMVTCFDGYEMAKKGRAGAALSAAAIGSWIAGTLGLVGLMLFAPPLAKAALAFGPPEYVAITILGLVMLANLSGGKPLKAFLMVLIGILLASIGIDNISGQFRFTFGNRFLLGGLDLVPIIMGLFGIAEVLFFLERPDDTNEMIPVKFKELYPTKEEIKRIIPPSLRGTVLGFFLGLIPGPVVMISSFVSYIVEKKVSKRPELFGTGVIEGVAGPESANNSATAGAMVPLLALGIPFAPATAMLLSSFVIHDITPGPSFITEHADMFWTIIASMYIGNVILILLNLPLVGVFASILRVDSKILMPIVILLCLVGAFAINGNVFDVGVMILCGLLGYVLKKVNLEPAPLVVGFILGPILETSIRQSQIMLNGNLIGLFLRPVSGTIFAIIGLVLIFFISKWLFNKYHFKTGLAS